MYNFTVIVPEDLEQGVFPDWKEFMMEAVTDQRWPEMFRSWKFHEAGWLRIRMSGEVDSSRETDAWLAEFFRGNGFEAGILAEFAHCYFMFTSEGKPGEVVWPQRGANAPVKRAEELEQGSQMWSIPEGAWEEVTGIKAESKRMSDCQSQE
jgi:hypothetical protein